jgi:hypothetical protein
VPIFWNAAFDVSDPDAVKRPLFLFRAVSGELEERNLITATYGMTPGGLGILPYGGGAVTPGAVDPPSI